MRTWRKVFFFLLLNAAVSACATYAVLSYWDRTHDPIPGGVLSSIGQSAPLAAPLDTPVAGIGPTPSSPATPTPVYIAYRVEEGDTLESVAGHYGLPASDVASANNLDADIALTAGDVLRIPLRPTPAGEPGIEIVGVVGPQDLASERVVLRQVGPGVLTLAGWQLEDQNGHVFVFPYLELARDGYEVAVYTHAGADSPNKVYWGLEQAVWDQGEKVTLRDAEGRQRAVYEVR